MRAAARQTWVSRAVAVVAGIVAASASVGCKPAPSHPNVLVIVVDDLGWADVGYRGSWIKTPRIDDLARTGVRMQRFYAQPWCIPTRESLMLGDPEFRVARDVGPTREPATTGITADHDNLAIRFQDAGYQTALVGKWHLGTSEASHPNRNGFAHFYGMLGGVVDFYTKEAFDQHDWERNGEVVRDDGYATDLLGDEAVRFLAERDRGRPFFLVLSFNAVHFPVQAPQAASDAYWNARLCRDPLRCVYMAQVTAMDRQVGRVLAALEDVRDETLVVFMSDNGGDETLNRAENAPLRGEKSTAYEGGIRVVALMSWPGVLDPGVRKARMRVSDLWATLESAAGLERRAPPSSRDLWDALRSGATPPREPFVFHAPDGGRAVIDGPWKLVEDPGSGGVELFRVDDDPYERSDLAVSNPEVVERLRSHFAASP